MIFALALTLVATAAPDVSPEPRRLAILPAIVPGPYGQSTLESIHGGLAAAAEFRLGLSVASFNEIQVHGAEPVAAAVRGCGSDPACAARALRLSGYDLGLQVIANFALDPPLVTVALLEVASGTNRGEVVVELSAGEPLVERVAKEANVILDRAGHPRGGRLRIETSPADSTIIVGGRRPDAGERGIYTVPAGAQRVEVMHAGFVTEVRDVEVPPGQWIELQFRLNPVQVEERSLLASPWFWGVVGVVALSAATATVLVVTHEPTPSCLCVSTPTSSCGACP